MSFTVITLVTNQTTESPGEGRVDRGVDKDVLSNWIIFGCLAFGVVFIICILALVTVALVRLRKARQQEEEPENVLGNPGYISQAPVDTVSSSQLERQLSSGQIRAWSPGTAGTKACQGISSNDSENHSHYDCPRRPCSPVFNFGSQPTSPISPRLPRGNPSLHSPGTVNPGYNSLDTSPLHGGTRYPQYASLTPVESPYDYPPSSKLQESDYDRLPSAKPVKSDYYPLSSVTTQRSDYDHLPTSRAISSDYDRLPLSKAQSSDYDHLPVPKAVSSGYDHLPLSKAQSSDYDHLPEPKPVFSGQNARSLLSDYDQHPVPMAVSPDNEHRPLSSDYDRLPSPRQLAHLPASKVLSSDYDTLPGTVRRIQPVQDQHKDDAHLRPSPPTPLPRKSKKPCSPAFRSPFNRASNKDQRDPSAGHLRAPYHGEASVVGTDRETSQSEEEESIYANFSETRNKYGS